jgi:hypothetical protein
MDPANPQRVVNDQSLTRVQRWVMSVLAVTTILHMSGGLILASLVIDASTASRVLLCVIGGAFGVIAVAVGLGIHGRNVVSPWLLLGFIPLVVGLVLVLS